MPIQIPPAAAPAIPIARRQKMGDADCVVRPAAVEARPPTIKAPSLPTERTPARAGSNVHNAQSIRGAARNKVFCNEYQLSKPALYMEAKTPIGFAPAAAQKNPKTIADATRASTGITTDSAPRRASRTRSNVPVEPLVRTALRAISREVD